MVRDLSRINTSNPQLASQARQHLARRMGRLRGLPQKLGQSLAMTVQDPDDNPFADLEDGAEPFPFPIMEAILQEVWGQPWPQVLSSLEPHGRAASLGQVHKGILPDGRAVAVKIAYPGIREAVFNDLRMLGWLAKPAEFAIAGFQLEEYRSTLFSDLEEELDYQLEAQHQELYACLTHPSDPVTTPQVISQLSSQRVLVTVWEDGTHIDEACQWSEQERFKLAVNLVKHFLRMLFEHGLVHADPHPGNYRFLPSGQIIIYDYGSVAKLEPQKRLLLLRLILASQEQKGDPFSLLQGLGFKPDLLEPIRAKLPALCQVLFEPFLCPAKFDPTTWDRAQKIDDILGKDRWNFRMSGPAAYIFLIRAFQGVFYYLKRLQVQVSWNLLLQPIMQRKFPELLAIAVPPPAANPVSFNHMARFLCIQVERNGQQTVSLKFPASSIDRLEDLMGEEVLSKTRQKGLDMRAVVKKARSSGLAPTELFQLQEDNKNVRVWLQ